MQRIGVVFEPIELKLGPGLAVPGGRLRLYSLGRGRSQVASGETKPAKLIFFAGFKVKERGAGDPVFDKFAPMARCR